MCHHDCRNQDVTPTRRAVLKAAGAIGLAAATVPLLGIEPAGATGSTGSATIAGAGRGRRRPHRVLVYSRTAGFRHASIPLGIATIEQLGSEHGFAVEASEDPAVFTDRNLRRFTAVVFLNTTGTVTTPTARRSLRRFVLDGGGWVGVHSAADTEYHWPFYARLLAGAHFLCHPLEQPGVIVRENAHHISTAHLPKRWQIPIEEFYSFRADPRGRADVLLSIDETSYKQDPNTTYLPSQDYPNDYHPVSGVMGDHPMCWQHRVGHGVAWYTALGHEVNMYLDPSYRQHLLGGILTATRHGQRHLR